MSAYTRLAAQTTLAVAACAAALIPAVAQAQINQVNTSGSVRLGVYIPTSSQTQNQFGRTYFNAGLDYYFQHTGVTERSLVSVDYFERSSGSDKLQVVPVTVGQQYVSGSRGDGVRPYFGFGAGVYFIHVQNPNDGNLTGGPNNGSNNDSASGETFGGYGSVGLDLSTNLFLDARYHLVSSYRSVSPSGFELTAGFRF